MVKVVVEVQGGLVTSVTTDGPGVEVYVVDRDIEDWSLGGSNKWPDAEHLKEVGGLQLADVSPGRVSTLLGVIAAECEYCDGTGLGEGNPGDSRATRGPCQECEGRGWWLPYAEPASADPGCACGLADRGAPGHQEEAATGPMCEHEIRQPDGSFATCDRACPSINTEKGPILLCWLHLAEYAASVAEEQGQTD